MSGLTSLIVAEYLSKSSLSVEEMNLGGIDKIAFDFPDLLVALEKTHLKKLDITPGKFGNNLKGCHIDQLLEIRLKEVVATNGHLVIHGVNETGRKITIQP